MQLNNKTYNKQNLFDRPFTLRDILLVIFPLTTFGLLLYQHFYIVEQRKQIVALTNKIDELTHSYEKLSESVISLQQTLKNRDLEFDSLKQTIENITTTPISSVNQSALNTMPVNYDFYFKAVAITFCFCLVAGTSLWLTGNILSPLTYVKGFAKGTAQKFGYWNDEIVYSYVFRNDYYWHTKIINNKDLFITVKYPGSGEYVDAYSLLHKLITASVNSGSFPANLTAAAAGTSKALVSTSSAAATTAAVTATQAATIAASNADIIADAVSKLPY